MSEILATYAPYIAIGVIVVTFVVIFFNVLRPAPAFLLAALFLVVINILTPAEFLQGFSNPSLAAIVLLILITNGFRKNFNLEALFNRLMGTANTYRKFLLRMMAQVAFFSSFINNTPVVTFMVPYVFDWGKKRNISPSKLLIPLSFATILGGMITIIGTSTTLVLNGFLADFDYPGLVGHELLIIGSIVTVSGILFFWSIGHKLLPDNRDLQDNFQENKQEFLVETILQEDSALVGQSIHDADLRNLPGVYLAEILRDKRAISPVPPEEILQTGDSLIFAGETNNIMELVNRQPGLSLPKVASRLAEHQNSQSAEVVVGNNSSMVGKRVKDTDFRNRYDAAIVAVNRGGERLQGKIGDIRLSPGDVLLLLVGPAFQNQIEVFRDLILISAPSNWKRPNRRKTYALGLVVAVAVILLALGVFSLFTSLLIIFGLMGFMQMITIQDIKRELDVNLVVTLVMSLALGHAIAKTGAGTLLAEGLLSWLIPYGNLAVLIGILLITTLLTSFVTNVAAVSITFPIALSLAQSSGIDPAPLFLAIAYGASAAFLTPIGYQTNLIVYGPGGYTFKDFLRAGFPITAIYLVLVTLGIMLLYPSVF